MTIMHPIDILKAKRTEVVDERTKIQEEAERIQARLSDISGIVTEYDNAIAREEGIVIVPAINQPDPTAKHELYPFIESELKPIAPAECTRKCGDLTYGRKGDKLTIRTVTGKCLNTSWEYICNYYHALPDTTRYPQIELNKDKRFALVSFYERHPNFVCSIIPDPDSQSKLLVKGNVKVGIETNVAEKAEDDVSAY